MICRECGQKMNPVKRVMKATTRRKAVYRFVCNCGYEQSGTVADKDINLLDEHILYSGIGADRAPIKIPKKTKPENEDM